jgi:hypothetical protein
LRLRVYAAAVIFAPLGGIVAWLILRNRHAGAERTLGLQAILLTMVAWIALSLPTCAAIYGFVAALLG